MTTTNVMNIGGTPALAGRAAACTAAGWMPYQEAKNAPSAKAILAIGVWVADVAAGAIGALAFGPGASIAIKTSNGAQGRVLTPSSIDGLWFIGGVSADEPQDVFGLFLIQDGPLVATINPGVFSTTGVMQTRAVITEYELNVQAGPGPGVGDLAFLDTSNKAIRGAATDATGYDSQFGGVVTSLKTFGLQVFTRLAAPGSIVLVNMDAVDSPVHPGDLLTAAGAGKATQAAPSTIADPTRMYARALHAAATTLVPLAILCQIQDGDMWPVPPGP